MTIDNKKGTGSGPMFAVLALAGAAGLAYFAYRRLADRGGEKVDSLMDLADRASRALEQRLDEYAVAS